MSHKHALNTFTPDFKINAITREVIQVQPDVLITLMQYDHNSEKLRFECPRYIDGHDMSLCNKVEVHFVNSDVAGGTSKGGYYTVTDIGVNSSDPSLVNFSWVVSRNSTENVGTLVFSVRFICVTGDVIDYVWHTLPFTYVSVDQGLVNELDPEYQKIYLDNLETEAGKKVVEAGNATTTALEAAERASEAINDLYSMDVTDKAPAIVCEASGEVISITDSANMPLKGLRVFGKSTQDGTPTPDSPVAIVSVENPMVKVCCKNLLPYPYTFDSRTMNGVTFTVNDDGSITANGTATAGISFHLATALTLPAGRYIFSGCPSDGSLNTYRIYYSDNITKTVADYGKNSAFTLEDDFTGQVVIQIFSNAVIDNLTFYPMIRPAFYEDNKYEVGPSHKIGVTHTLHGIPVTSGGNYTDSNGQQWICDEVDFERGVYVQRVGVVNFDGSTDEDWGGVSESTANARNWITVADAIVLNGDSSQGIICSQFKPLVSNTVGQFYQNGNRFFFGSGMTLSVWKTHLQTNPLILLYRRLVAVETPLTETEIAAYKALHTNKPNTIIVNDSGAWQSVDYVADTKLYIDNKFAELAKR